MTAFHTTPVIHVTDLDRALDYYVKVLGFTVDFKLPAYAGLLLDDICIHISGPANQGMHKPPGTAHFCIDCDEVDKYFDTISKSGAFIIAPLEDRYYGVRDFAVNDHDGNTLVFGSVLDTWSPRLRS